MGNKSQTETDRKTPPRRTLIDSLTSAFSASAFSASAATKPNHYQASTGLQRPLGACGSFLGCGRSNFWSAETPQCSIKLRLAGKQPGPSQSQNSSSLCQTQGWEERGKTKQSSRIYYVSYLGRTGSHIPTVSKRKGGNKGLGTKPRASKRVRELRQAHLINSDNKLSHCQAA